MLETELQLRESAGVATRSAGATGASSADTGVIQSNPYERESRVMPSKSSVLLRLFRSLMPREEHFIEWFAEHAELIVQAAEEFRGLMSGDGRIEQHAAEISRLEDAADRVTRRTVQAIHRTFVTPFDRSQI